MEITLLLLNIYDNEKKIELKQLRKKSTQILRLTNRCDFNVNFNIYFVPSIYNTIPHLLYKIYTYKTSVLVWYNGL